MRSPLVHLGILLLAAGLSGAAETQEKPEYEWSGYFQTRYVSNLDADTDEWQIPSWRVKLTDNLGPDDKLVLTVEKALKAEKWGFHWIDAYVQHRWQPSVVARAGLTNVPFGFDNPQSTPCRVTLDSPAVIARILPGKRDLGLFLVKSPPKYSKLFREMEKCDYGSADMGIAAVGFYAGAGRDDNPAGGAGHFVARGAYPFTFGHKQIGEVGASFFTGRYATRSSLGERVRITDRALGAHAFIAPRPFGFQGEWVTGKMPGLDGIGETRARDFDGWYAMGTYRPWPRGIFYVRAEDFSGFTKVQEGQPKLYDYTRQSYGFRYNIATRTDLTVEFENIKRNGTDEDRFSAQMMYQY